MKIPKDVQRVLVGAGLGALVGSGRLQEVGTRFMDALLKPMIDNKRASEYVGRVIFEAYYEAQEPGAASARNWRELSVPARDRWCRIGSSAIKAVAHMVSQAIAGKGR